MEQKHAVHREFHTFVDYPAPAPGIIVPQAADNERSRQASEDIVQLKLKGSPLHGIRLGGADILGPQITLLQDVNRPVRLLDGTNELIVRIMWPGYPTWDKRVPLGNANAQVPLSKFAAVVTGTITQFLKEMYNVPSSEARPDWWITGINIESLVLLEVRRTAPGTWQPMLCRVVS